MRLRSTFAFALWITLTAVAALAARLPVAEAGHTGKANQLALKSGYLAERGLLDRNFSAVQLIVELNADGTGSIWDDPNIQPDHQGFFYDRSQLGELPE